MRATALRYFADPMLALSMSLAEIVLADLDTDISSSGYGQNLVPARSVANRRRWWALKALCKHEITTDEYYRY